MASAVLRKSLSTWAMLMLAETPWYSKVSAAGACAVVA